MYIEITVGPEDSRVDDRGTHDCLPKATTTHAHTISRLSDLTTIFRLSKCFDSLSRYANAYNLSFLLIL